MCTFLCYDILVTLPRFVLCNNGQLGPMVKAYSPKQVAWVRSLVKAGIKCNWNLVPNRIFIRIGL